MNPVGLTKDVGWQIGVRRTIDVSPGVLWDFIISPGGMRCWFGDVDDFSWDAKAVYALPDGTHGEVRVFKPHSHVRLTWHPPAYPHASTIQVHVISKGDRAVLAFHQEHLPDQQAREDRRAFFRTALDKIEAVLTV
jgi:uncharacterized protein YndB with AHSA1/START domain